MDVTDIFTERYNCGFDIHMFVDKAGVVHTFSLSPSQRISNEHWISGYRAAMNDNFDIQEMKCRN